MDMTPCGFPHSEICGSTLICSSPQLIASYHVFRRLSVPRHSPCALSSLTSILCSILNICQRDFLRHCRFITYFRLKISFAEFLLFSVFSFQGTLDVHSLSLVKSAKLLSQFAQEGCSCLPVKEVVGSNGFEPSTSRLSGARSNQLSYEPIFWWR